MLDRAANAFLRLSEMMVHLRLPAQILRGLSIMSCRLLILVSITFLSPHLGTSEKFAILPSTCCHPRSHPKEEGVAANMCTAAPHFGSGMELVVGDYCYSLLIIFASFHFLTGICFVAIHVGAHRSDKALP